MTTKRPAIDRLRERVEVDATSGCWNFTGHLSPGGYGSISDDTGRNTRTHRVAYEALIGPIPAGLDLDHLCRNRACCNPAHLEPVTRSENLRRSPLMGKWMIRDVCKRGHDRSPENLYIKSDGRRDCRLCARDRYYAKRDAA